MGCTRVRVSYPLIDKKVGSNDWTVASLRSFRSFALRSLHPAVSAQTGTAAQKAVRYQTECDAGNADRCNQLGIAYQFGLGVTADKAHATAAYAKADVLLESASGIVPAVLRVRHH